MSDFLISSLQGDGINLSFFQFLWYKHDHSKEMLKNGNFKSQADQHNQSKGPNNLIRGVDDELLYQEEKLQERSHLEHNLNPIKDTNLRIPDTVIFHYGQPFHWYFTSHKGSFDEGGGIEKTDPSSIRKRKRIPKILQKRRQNLNMVNIEREFLKKCRSEHSGNLDSKRDIVAYFIASKDCTNRRHHSNVAEQSNRQDMNSSWMTPSIAQHKVSNVSNQSHVTQENTDAAELEEEDEVLCDIEYFNSEDLRT